MSNLAVAYQRDSIHLASRADQIPWAGAIVLLLATLSMIFGKGMTPATSGIVAPFELQATDVGGQMQIHWNARASAISQAETAVFEAMDGGKLYRFPLSGRVLASGAIQYVRRSDDVAATLILFTDGKETDRRTVRSVSAPRPH